MAVESSRSIRYHDFQAHMGAIRITEHVHLSILSRTRWIKERGGKVYANILLNPETQAVHMQSLRVWKPRAKYWSLPVDSCGKQVDQRSAPLKKNALNHSGVQSPIQRIGKYTAQFVCQLIVDPRYMFGRKGDPLFWAQIRGFQVSMPKLGERVPPLLVDVSDDSHVVASHQDKLVLQPVLKVVASSKDCLHFQDIDVLGPTLGPGDLPNHEGTSVVITSWGASFLRATPCLRLSLCLHQSR
jgi:hypothetical protein